MAIIAILLFLFILVPAITTRYAKSKIIESINNNSQYTLEIGDLSLKGWNGLVFTSIKMKPKLDRYTYNKENGYNSDWITVEIDQLTMEGIDWKQYFSHKLFYVEQISLDKPSLYAFRDMTLPDAPFERQPLPAELLREASQLFTIGQIDFNQGSVTYEEIPPTGGSTHVVPFTDLNGQLIHLSSDSSYFQKHPVGLTITGNILESIYAHLDFAFETADKHNAFLLEGYLGDFEAKLLNEYVIPHADLKITSGQVDSIWFNMKANEDVSEGILHMDYHDLTITSNPSNESKKIVDFKKLAAKLFIKEKSDVELQENLGFINFERTKDRFIFNYIWNSFKTGIALVVINLPDNLLEKKLRTK